MSDEWYTPQRYVDAARECMGGIDLDPASCEAANRTVKASSYFSKSTNGLDRAWFGRVWLNPPFSRSQTPGKKHNQGLWVRKLVDEYREGNIEQAVLLTTCRPDTSWFALLWEYAICFCDHKVGFFLPSEGQILQEHSHAHGTLFVYLGSRERHFVDAFSRFGPVIPGGVAIRRQAVKPIAPQLWEVPAWVS